MSKLRLPPFHDIARIIGRDENETEVRLYNHLTNPDSAPFNYRCARNLSPFAFSRALPLPQILQGCQRERTKHGRLANEKVLSLLFGESEGRSVQTFELGPQFLDIRKDLRIRVALPFYFVENGQACAFWLQPRKNYAYDVSQLSLLASMVKAAVLRDDFQDVDFEMHDMSAPAKNQERKPTIYRLESFRLLSEAEVHDRLQLVAVAYDRIVARGIQRSQRTPKRPPEQGPDLLGGE